MTDREVLSTPSNPNIPLHADINGQGVNVILLDPSQQSAELTSREVWAVRRMDHLLRANPRFQTTFPKAQLEAVSCDRQVPEAMPGHYHLKYRSPAGSVTFQGSVGPMTTLDIEAWWVEVVPTGR